MFRQEAGDEQDDGMCYLRAILDAVSSARIYPVSLYEHAVILQQGSIVDYVRLPSLTRPNHEHATHPSVPPSNVLRGD